MFRELFNVPVVIKSSTPSAPRDLQPPLPGQPTPPEPSPTVQREGAFITVQSLVSFPGAVAAVTVIVNVVGWAIPAWSGHRLLFLIASALVGLTIYFINESDPLKLKADRRQRGISFIIAFFNTLVILSAAIGADALVRSPGPPSTQAQTVEVNNG